MAKLNSILIFLMLFLLATATVGAPAAKRGKAKGEAAKGGKAKGGAAKGGKVKGETPKGGKAKGGTDKDIADVDREAEHFAFPPGSSDLDEGFDDEPVITPKQQKYLQNCAKKMTPECAKEVFSYMFEDMNVTKKCCEVLVAMGEPCHIALVKTVTLIPEYRANAPTAIRRSKHVWNECALVVDAYAPSPVPFEI